MDSVLELREQIVRRAHRRLSPCVHNSHRSPIAECSCPLSLDYIQAGAPSLIIRTD